ncbi:MAG: ROK family protein [Petrotoga mobilis]|nr:MAG: ROK family protein [Petrotoga mobilis]
MANKTYNIELVKERNRSLVLELLNSKGTSTRSEIADITGLTNATITNIVNELIFRDLVEEVGTVDGKLGRKRKLIRIKEDAFYVIGVEFGVNIVRTGIFNFKGKKIKTVEKEINSYGRPTDVLKDLILIIDELINNSKVDNNKIKGIGIVMPGLIDSQKRVLRSVHPFPLLKDYPLVEQLEEHYKKTIWLENDANGAVLGEKWFGHGKKFNNYVFVVGDSGIGAGIVINGRLYSGASNSAGEIGHTFMTKDFIPLESFGGLSRLADDFKLPLEIILNESKNSDEIKKALDDISKFLALGIVNLVNTVDPEAIIVGGRILKAGNSVIREIKKIVEQYTFSDKVPQILVASKKEDALLFGAASIAIEHIVASPYQFLLNNDKSVSYNSLK